MDKLELAGISWARRKARWLHIHASRGIKSVSALCLQHGLARKGLAVFNRYAHSAGPMLNTPFYVIFGTQVKKKNKSNKCFFLILSAENAVKLYIEDGPGGMRVAIE